MKFIVLFSFTLINILCFAQKKAVDSFICPPCNGGCDDVIFSKQGKCNRCSMTLIKKTTKLETQNKTICFYLQDGVEVLDFAGPLEVFTAAGFKVFIVSKTKDRIISQGILTVVPDYSIEDAPFSQIMVFLEAMQISRLMILLLFRGYNPVENQQNIFCQFVQEPL